jgi:hypothetical protein
VLVLTASAAVLLATAIERGGRGDDHPWHTDIVTTTFWVGEVFAPDESDGSQVVSTYDSDWLGSYGGCDGIVRDGRCDTEPRTADNGFFPTAMTPRQNPFYLDLPFDDVNDDIGFVVRRWVVPWAHREPYASWVDDRSMSLMKNRWVHVRHGDRECFGQVEDAGPGQYHDVAYVFGGDDARPVNRRYNGAGMDVSPAMNGCLGLTELDGEDDRVDWRFVEQDDVPQGPWKEVITTTPPR